tara:strand:+ start:8850 stop:10013 length:1164 start_codon:yes stop_codon:yes gene_type:complete
MPHRRQIQRKASPKFGKGGLRDTKANREKVRKKEIRRRLQKESKERRKEKVSVKKEEPVRREPVKKKVVEPEQIKLEKKRVPLREQFPKITKAMNIGAGITAAGLALLGTRNPIAAKEVGTAVITRTAFQGQRTVFNQRALVGKPPKSQVDKIFKSSPERGATASRFANNRKSQGLSSSILSKGGMSLAAASLAVGAIGSYPFAGFIKEEAVQTLSVAIFKAVDAGDLDGAEELTEQVDEIINMDTTDIPYANVLQNLNVFFEAARAANEEWERIIELIREEAEGPSFEEQRVASDEASFERRREFQEEQSEIFEEIERERVKTREREASEETEKFAQIDEERKQRAIKEQELDIKKSRVFALRREGKFEEADDLEREILAELKGGN